MPFGRIVCQLTGLGLSAGLGWWAAEHATSTAVSAWAPGMGERRRAGPLAVRTLGSAEPVVLLLHGMIAAGNSFGATYDELAEVATLVVPDLLGFGGSMLTSGPIDSAAHVRALDEALCDLGLAERPTVVVGHSMGGGLALRWAAANTERVQAVVTFGAPLYRDRAEADKHVHGMGRMQALLSGDGTPAQTALRLDVPAPLAGVLGRRGIPARPAGGRSAVRGQAHLGDLFRSHGRAHSQ